MNTKREKKLKNVNSAKNIHEINDCMVDDEDLMINNTLSLSICLKPQDDFPHPRHLCFTYPFGKSSPKKHCIKCYCYVCEKIAPCKYWKKTPKRHCDATEKDEKWVVESKLHKKLPGSTTMIYHKLTVFACYHLPEGPDLPVHGFGGGLICNSDGEWVIGISTHLCSTIGIRDMSAQSYIALLEGLQLAWSKGFRFLEVSLGFVFHVGFWTDFTRDAVTKKFRLCVNPYDRALVILKDVEDYLNREWLVCVKNTESCEEESGAAFVAVLAEFQEEAKKVYDFKAHPVDTEKITRELTSDIHEQASFMFDLLDYDASAELKKYFGLN